MICVNIAWLFLGKEEKMKLKIFPVDHMEALSQELPGRWPELRSRGFHDDLYLRVAAANLWGRDRQWVIGKEILDPFLAKLAEGYSERFSKLPFLDMIGDDDEHRELKVQALYAVDELAEQFGNRLPALLWRTMAFIAVREAPTEDRSIIAEVQKSTLPEHYTYLDACLHALGKVYSLNFHVASVFYKRTGHVPIHNCDCGCSLHSLAKPSGGMHFELPRENMKKATESFLTHLLAEFVTLAGLKLPFELGVGDDAAAALAIERDGL